MKKMIFRIALIVTLFMGVSSCEEDQDPVENAEDIEASDDFLLPVELILSGTYPCGIDKIDTVGNTYRVYFDGKECPGSIKQYGMIDIVLVKGERWRDKDAEVEVIYIDYTNKKEVESVDTLKKAITEIKLNGSERLVNASGSDFSDFEEGNTMYLRRRSAGNNLSVEYNDTNEKRYFNKVSVREMINSDGEITFVSHGDTTINGFENVQEWGVNSYGRKFYNVISQPIVKTYCYERWILTSGEKIRYTERNPNKPRVNLYGVDENGKVVGTCESYGFSVTWEDSEGEKRKIIYKY